MAKDYLHSPPVNFYKKYAALAISLFYQYQ